MSTVLGVDIGTQSVKAVIYDADLKDCIATASAPLKLEQSSDGSASQRAGWWILALQQAVSKLDRNVRLRVSAIGVSGQQHGFVPIDESGKVLAPVKLWCDTSTTAE